METLQRRSDGICETPSGLYAIILLYRSGENTETAWFEYKTTAMSPTFRVEWPVTTDFVLLDQETATGLLNLNYARHLQDSELEAYNLAIEEAIAKEAAEAAAKAATK